MTFILGKEWVLYGCCVHECPTGISVDSYGKNTISREGKWGLEKIVFNANMISAFAGVVLFFTKIRLPEIVDQALSSVGSMIGPASMIVTGMLIAEMNLLGIYFENVKVYFISFLRLVDTGDIIGNFKNKRACEHTSGWKKLLLIVFPCGDHNRLLPTDHADVSGVWK